MILGIAGTAKNTGKTTTTNAIIEKANQVNLRVGLTSIGYDGEDIDHVTDLPKPRVILDEGNLVAIARGCLKGSTAQIEVLAETDLLTPLGKIIIGVVKARGRVVVAGPNKAKDLRVVLEMLTRLGAGLILVDGALNRLAPMVVTEGLVLATGAARKQDIDELAHETAAIQQILALPIGEQAETFDEAGITLIQRNSAKTVLPFGSLLVPASVDQLLQAFSNEVETLYIPGVMETEALKRMVTELVQREFRGKLVIHDPIKLLVGSQPLIIEEMIGQLRSAGISVTVCMRVPLRLITINPFYPRYRVQYRNYQPDYVDADLLQDTVQSLVSTKVVNVVREGIDLDWLL